MNYWGVVSIFLLTMLIFQIVTETKDETLDITCKQFYGNDAHYERGLNKYGGIRCLRELKAEAYEPLVPKYAKWTKLPIQKGG